jgi:hypothetical protein
LRKQYTYTITHDEWQQLKTRISRIPKQKNLFQTLGAAAFGVSATAGAFLLSLLTLKDVANWLWIASWVAFLVFLVAGPLCFIFDKGSKEDANSSVSNVLEDMESIQSRFMDPQIRPPHD